MPKSDLQFDSNDYAPVADRIRLFYAAHPEGRIITRLVSHENGHVVFMAKVYRDSTGGSPPAAVGWAREREGDGEINTVACFENTETSAVGRALANLGFTASSRRPSAEEMRKADRVRERVARERAGYATATTGTPNPPDRLDLRASATGSEALQEHANAVSDVLRLLDAVVRAGFDAQRAERIRARLSAGRGGIPAVERAERSLRSWLDARGSTPPCERADPAPPTP